MTIPSKQMPHLLIVLGVGDGALIIAPHFVQHGSRNSSNPQNTTRAID